MVKLVWCSLFKYYRIFINISSHEPSKFLGHTGAMLRTMVLTRLVSHGDKPTIEKAEKLFESYRAESKMVPPDLQTPVYRAILSSGNESILEKLETVSLFLIFSWYRSIYCAK
jgi:hypothetical protein